MFCCGKKERTCWGKKMVKFELLLTLHNQPQRMKMLPLQSSLSRFTMYLLYLLIMSKVYLSDKLLQYQLTLVSLFPSNSEALTDTPVWGHGVNRHKSLPPLISSPKQMLVLSMTKKNLLTSSMLRWSIYSNIQHKKRIQETMLYFPSRQNIHNRHLAFFSILAYFFSI